VRIIPSVPARSRCSSIPCAPSSTPPFPTKLIGTSAALATSSSSPPPCQGAIHDRAAAHPCSPHTLVLRHVRLCRHAPLPGSLWMLRRSVDETEYHELQERAEDVQVVLSHEDPAQNLRKISDDFSSIYEMKDDGKYLQVRDAEGNWIFRSRRMIAQNPVLPAPGLLPKAASSAEFHQGTRHVRILAYPIESSQKALRRPNRYRVKQVHGAAGQLPHQSLLLTPIVILLAAVGGHLMSRKALRPMAALAAQARGINERNLETRLPVPGKKTKSPTFPTPSTRCSNASIRPLPASAPSPATLRMSCVRPSPCFALKSRWPSFGPAMPRSIARFSAVSSHRPSRCARERTFSPRLSCRMVRRGDGGEPGDTPRHGGAE